jgi:endonuclease III
MKDSSEYSKKIKKLYRSLKNKGSKITKVIYDDPINALVYAIISETTSEKQAQDALKKFSEHFLDLNDLRVSRPEEIIEMFGDNKVVTKEVAANLKAALHKIFEKHNIVSLIDLKKLGKRPAKDALEKIEGVGKFAVDYCMLTAFGGHCIPLTPKMTEYLKREHLVHPHATDEEIEGFLTRRIAAKDGFEFYRLLRKESESAHNLKFTKKASRKSREKKQQPAARENGDIKV